MGPIWKTQNTARICREQDIATLEWAKSWGSLATGKTADGEWTFKRVGFLRPGITVRERGSETNLGVMSMDWTGGGALDLSGEEYHLRSSSFWQSERSSPIREEKTC